MQWIKKAATFIWGYVFGFGTLLVLFLMFGNYEQSAQAEPAIVAGPSPTATIAPTDVPPDAPTVAAIVEPLPTSTEFPTPTPIPVATATPIPAAILPPAVMNQDLVIDGILWRAIAVQEIGNLLQSDNDWADDATTDGKFVQVTMRVENRRNVPESGYEAPDIMDAQGRRFRAYEERFYYLPDGESCSLETFNPNLTRTCTEIYAVAADSAGAYKIIVNNFNFIDPTEAIIELR